MASQRLLNGGAAPRYTLDGARPDGVLVGGGAASPEVPKVRRLGGAGQPGGGDRGLGLLSYDGDFNGCVFWFFWFWFFCFFFRFFFFRRLLLSSSSGSSCSSCSFLFFLVLSCSFLFFFHLVLLVVLQTLLRRLFPELCFELFLELVFCFELVSFELNISEPPLTLINDYFEHSLYDQVRARRRRRRRGRLGRQHSRHSWRDAFSAHDAIPSAASPPPYQQ